MKILAVDDDPLSLEVLGALVGQLGQYELVKATSAVDAIEALSDEAASGFDCLLLDICMPGTDGIELCRIIRGMEGFKRIPILMVTAKSDKTHIDRAFSAGATDYLTKPFEIAELRGRLQMIEGLVQDTQVSTRKIFAARGRDTKANLDRKIDLFQQVEIVDVEGVVEYHALENYVAQLSRKSLFGSSVLAVQIIDFERLHRKANSFDLAFAITDVAEAISDALGETSFLMAYAGNGTYVCVIEGGWRPDATSLARTVNEILLEMDLHLSDGQPIPIEIFAGDAIRMISRVGARAVDALSEAQELAQKSCREYLQDPMGKGTFWEVS